MGSWHGMHQANASITGLTDYDSLSHDLRLLGSAWHLKAFLSSAGKKTDDADGRVDRYSCWIRYSVP
jgi:hypothetical protein